MPKELDIPPDTHISYDDAVEYWASVPATVDGVLGGFGASVIPKVDIVGSNAFLGHLTSGGSFGQVPRDQRIGLDIGAGIGRVTKNFLSKHCGKVDMVEPVEKLISQARVELAEEQQNGLIGEFYLAGAQEFEPEHNKYWLIWCQWCLGHLSDDNLVKFFRRCIDGLHPSGILVFKENNCYIQDEFDDTDSSVTRTDEKFKHLVDEAGLHLLYYRRQAGMPKSVYPVTMYACIPKTRLERVSK